MAEAFINLYSGEPDQTCSVSFTAQQAMAGTVGSPQTEAQYNQSKLLGEWGVIKAKLAKGEIATGTKLLTFTTKNGGRGYLYAKGTAVYQRLYTASGKKLPDLKASPKDGETFINSPSFTAAIPQAVAAKPKPEPVVVKYGDAGLSQGDKDGWADGQVLAVNANGQEYLKFNKGTGKVEGWLLDTSIDNWFKAYDSPSLSNMMTDEETWHKPDGKPSTTNATPAVTTPSPASSAQVAAPTPATPVNAGSTSVGSMTHEDVSAMFVKIKDDLAKQKGLNIKGANVQLDEEVYKAIGAKTGYTPAEVKGKIDAYKAAGNKLSALKKKVMAGTKKVPEGNPQPTHATPAAPLNVAQHTNTPAPDPQPNGVPTVATPGLANAIKQDVLSSVNANPAKVYSDEDVAAAYIIAKDKVVAESGGKWTLYTKDAKLDLEIATQVQTKTGLNPTEQKQAIANYLGSGKKLSTLKKQLAKQGAFVPKADTLKKSGPALTQAEKDAQVAAHAASGYTPTPTPATGTPPTSTGAPAPQSVKKKAQESGDISGIDNASQVVIFDQFKKTGSKSWLSSGSGQNYDGLLTAKAAAEAATGKTFTLLQVIRVVDEQGAKKAGVANGHLFENQVAKWLTTPEGTAYIKANEVKLAKEAQLAKEKAELEKKAKLLEASQPALPPDSSLFQDWSLEKAKRVSGEWLAAEPWDDRQKRDLKYYTSNAYREINGYLRGSNSSPTDRVKKAVVGARAGMRPTTEAILVKRGTGLNQFISLGVGSSDASLIWGITGKTFRDEGFLSTSAGGRAAFGGQARLEIECPVGTPMAYVDPISEYPGENEMLLQAGMEYKVLNVRKEGSTFVVRVRVVNWPGKVA